MEPAIRFWKRSNDMAGAVLNQNEEIHERSKRNVIRYYEQIEGKKALLKTWEECHPEDVDYIRELKARIRKATVLLSHIRHDPPL